MINIQSTSDPAALQHTLNFNGVRGFLYSIKDEVYDIWEWPFSSKYLITIKIATETKPDLSRVFFPGKGARKLHSIIKTL